MRYIRYIKANLISALKSFPALLLMVLMPFLLTLFLAFTTKGAFNPSDLTIETKIYIDNQDKGAFGEQIVALFAQLTEEKQIALTSVKDDAKIIATIPADFTQSRFKRVLKQLRLPSRNQGEHRVRRLRCMNHS